MKYQAESLQGALFPLPTSQISDALKLWEQLFGPDSADGFQRSANAPNLQTSANGSSHGYALNLTVQTGRIDLYIRPLPPQNFDSSKGPPSIKDIEAATSLFCELSKKISERYRPVRIALISELSFIVTEGDSDRNIRDAVHPLNIPDNTTDLSFQFNSRRRFQNVPDLEMNRLCEWSSGRVAFAPHGSVIPFNPDLSQALPYVGLRIDVNSAPEMHIPDNYALNVIDDISYESKAIREQGFSRFI